MSQEDIERLRSVRLVVASEIEDTGAVDQSFIHKITGDGEWEDVYTATEVSKPWEPVAPREGSRLFIQTSQGKFAEYLYENGRYSLVGEVTNG